ncbi:crotonase/enoyl-CoA hydratase family protein [Sneathiella sp. P13V-1]|nr:crotonase/enoyl-CoA hydratase family protein [Sneathiella sp. P13V-1]
MPNQLKIYTEIHGPVSVITLNRPESRNALDKEATELLTKAFLDFEQDDSQKVAVLIGAGGNFCAGADLKEVSKKADYKPWAGHPEGPLHRPLSKPVIGAISGYAVAGGLGISLYCDIRIADETAVFGIFCRRWGVPMSDGTPTRLPRIIGTGPAMDMMLTGDPVSAERAFELGLVTRLTTSKDLKKDAIELAERIATFPPIAMLADRETIYTQFGKDEKAALYEEWQSARQAIIQEASQGAAKFAAGSGRHGSIAD